MHKDIYPPVDECKGCEDVRNLRDRETLNQRTLRHDREIKELQRKVGGEPSLEAVIKSWRVLRDLPEGTRVQNGNGWIFEKLDNQLWAPTGDPDRRYTAYALVHMFAPLTVVPVPEPKTPVVQEQMLEEMKSLKDTLIARVQFGMMSSGFGPRNFDSGLVEGLSIATVQLQDLIERWDS